MIYCNELENGYDINLTTARVTHCCKHITSPVTPQEIENYGYKVLDLNSQTVKARADLANDIRTHSCRDCWESEDLGIKSWRQIQNELNLLKNDIRLNVQLGPLCNQSCMYCHSSLSTSIARFDYWINNQTGQKEINKPIRSSNILTMEHVIDYVDNIPLTKKAITLGFTGGEPFIVDKFNENIETLIRKYCEKDPSRQMNLVFSSNGNVDPENLLNFYSRLQSLKSMYKIKFTVGLSVENLFERAEYIRQGLKWDTFMKNFHIHYENANAVDFKMTINAFSIVNIADFVKYFKPYNVAFVYSYTQQKFFRSNILDNRFLPEIQRLEDYLKSENLEIKFKNYKVLYKSLTDDKPNAQIFKSAITDLDQIRGTNWRTVFPEYQQWFDEI
jgi:organic radical activating enzyme